MRFYILGGAAVLFALFYIYLCLRTLRITRREARLANAWVATTGDTMPWPQIPGVDMDETVYAIINVNAGVMKVHHQDGSIDVYEA